MMRKIFGVVAYIGTAGAMLMLFMSLFINFRDIEILLMLVLGILGIIGEKYCHGLEIMKRRKLEKARKMRELY